MPSPANNLPSTLTLLIGRAAERARVLAALDDPTCRLLTVVGPSGVGKTVLAMDVAREVTLRGDVSNVLFSEGVYFVPAGELQAAGTTGGTLQDVLATAIAEAIGLPLSAPESPWRQVRDHLRDKAMLLVLDNLDGFVHQIAPHILSLLRATGRLKIMATSWERLGVGGERVVVLDGLPYPRPKNNGDSKLDSKLDVEAFDSIVLFRQITRAVGADVVMAPAVSAAVVRICQMVDGLPLGIELAAIWTRVLTPQEIASEIAMNLEFLDASDLNRDVPERQRSLRRLRAFVGLVERRRAVRPAANVGLRQQLHPRGGQCSRRCTADRSRIVDRQVARAAAGRRRRCRAAL